MEMFHANKGYKLEIVVLIPTSPFAKQAFSGDTLFKRYFHEDKALHTQMNHFNTVFQMKWDKWQRFQTLRSSFSDESTFNFFFFGGGGGGGGWERFFLRSRVRIWIRFLGRYRLAGLSGCGLLYCFSEFR